MMAQQMMELILHLSHETDVMKLSKKMTKKKLSKQALKFILFRAEWQRIILMSVNDLVEKQSVAASLSYESI